MRLRPASVAASWNERKWRVVPGRLSLVTVMSARGPNALASTVAAAALIELWAPGYDGSGAVVVSAFHVGSAARAALPGVPARMAVIGRHTLYVYLASYMAMVASAMARFIEENALVAASRLVWRADTWFSAIWFHVVQIGAAQNLPIVVCSSVRTVLVSWPSCCTSVMASAHAAVSRAGGAEGRNSSGVSSRNGSTWAQFVKAGCGLLGGVDW